MSQQTINTPRDTTIQATNTALGLLGKDASLQDIKAALLQIVAALDPTADDYDDLSNKPQVNGVTLSGNKTSKQLGIRQTIPLTSAQYAQLTSAEKMDVDKDYIITDENATAAPIDDSTTSQNSVWSSYKTNNMLNWTLLWTAPDQNDVSAYDIQLPSNDFEYYILHIVHTWNTPIVSQHLIIPRQGSIDSFFMTGTQGAVGGTVYIPKRRYTANGNNITSSAGASAQFSSSPTTWATANSRCLLAHVYGVHR